ncbi:hypothetical protein D9M68_884200 [compost metagenome]
MYKGATPARLDAPAELLDVCNQVVIDLLQVPDGTVQNPFNTIDSDWNQALWNTMFSFWSDPNQTAEDVIETLRDEHDAIFG